MVLKSLRNELFGVLLAFFVGWCADCRLLFLFRFLNPRCCSLSGIPLSLFEWGEEHLVGGVWWGNPEQMSRGTVVSLISGAAIAIPCGAGAALSVVQGASMALVGVAVSAALLPPVVNSGMNAAYGVMGLLFPWTPAGATQSSRWISVAMFSFILFLINLVLIYVTALFFFKLKRIGPPRRVVPPKHRPSEDSTSVLEEESSSSNAETFLLRSPTDASVGITL